MLPLIADCWRSHNARAVERATPEHVELWLVRCTEAGRHVAMDTAGG